MKETELDPLITPNSTIGEIVAANYNTAGVFREFGMDFCCGGGITLKKACEKRDADINNLIDALHTIGKQSMNVDENFQSWEAGYLIDHIIATHHNFVRIKIEEISAYAEKVARVHGERHPENIAIHDKFKLLSSELITHLEAEESRLFPLIRTIYQSRISGENIPNDLIDSLKEELNRMEKDHDLAGALMKEISELSNQYTPPAYACSTYQILYKNLEGFEQNLHKHVHLENNILFKKAGQLI